MKNPVSFVYKPAFFALLLLFFFGIAANGQTTTTLAPTSTAALVKDMADPDDTWHLGFSMLTTDPDASSALKALSITLPKLWRQAFADDLQHRLSATEQTGIRKTLLEKAQNMSRVAISQAMDDRDKAWLAETLTTSQDTDAATKIKAARDKLAALLALSLDAIPIVDQKKIALTDASVDQALFPAVAKTNDASAEILATSQKLQVLVYGSLVESAGYVFIKAWAWNAYEKRRVWEYSTALVQDEAESLAEEQIEEMAGIILGFPSGEITVRAEPAGTLITLKPQNSILGSRREVGAARFRFLNAGTYTLTLGADGYLPRTETLTVEKGKTLDLSYKLETAPVRFVKVESVPSGASVYLFSRFQGLTPLQIPLPKEKTVAFVELDGYQRYQLIVSPDNPGPLQVPLMKDILNWGNEMKLRRDRFYDSLGLFGLSVLPPLILNGLYQNIVNALGRDPSNTGVNSDTYSAKAAQANLFYRLGLGTLIITGVAFVDMGINLSRYLEAADFASGRHE